MDPEAGHEVGLNDEVRRTSGTGHGLNACAPT
jgi:hypothetical protein